MTELEEEAVPLTYDSFHWAEVVNLIKVNLASPCYVSSILLSWKVHNSNLMFGQCIRGRHLTGDQSMDRVAPCAHCYYRLCDKARLW